MESANKIKILINNNHKKFQLQYKKHLSNLCLFTNTSNIIFRNSDGILNLKFCKTKSSQTKGN